MFGTIDTFKSCLFILNSNFNAFEETIKKKKKNDFLKIKKSFLSK